MLIYNEKCEFWQIPRLFRSNLQIPCKIVNSAENIKIHDFFRDHRIAEFWRAWQRFVYYYYIFLDIS